MARARNIKPAFFTNDDLAELSALERLAFIGLWTVSDFKGCIEFKPKRLKVQLLPYDNCDFEKIAINLDKSGFIRMYSVQGNRYLKILCFEKHQNPHKNERAAGSDIPDVDETDNENNELEKVEINPEQDGTARADSLNPITDSLNPPTRKTLALIVTNDFNSFWSSYPLKKNKDAAEKAWKKKKPPINDVLKALAWQVDSEDWTKSRGKFIPYPATYINAGGWKDEPTKARAAF